MNPQLIKLIIELGPIVVFFTANGYFADDNGLGGVVPATALFMVAMLISIIASKKILGEVSLMLKISAGLVAFFGGLTIYFNDPAFIQIKPTILYSLFALTLLGGCLFKKSLLRNVMEAGFPPLEDIAWFKMSRNWGLFFIGCALLNEYIRLNYSFSDWIAAKAWIFMPLSFVFMFTQMPLIMKHAIEEEKSD